MKKLTVWCSLWLCIGAYGAQGQEVINHNYDGYAEKEASLAEMAAQSSVIVEGKVIGQRGFWNDAHKKIYTANLVKVYKIFKGEVRGGQVEIVTEGGNVDDILTFTFDDDKLPVEGTGIFFGQPVTDGTGGSKLPADQVLKIYGFYQGHFSYRGDGPEYNTAVTASRRYRDVPKTLYEPIQRAVGHPYLELVPFDIDVFDVYADLRTGLVPNSPQAKAMQAKMLQKKSSNSSLSPSVALANPAALPVITSVSARQSGVLIPNGSVKGGTFDEIVVRGTGLVDATGSKPLVFFDNVDFLQDPVLRPRIPAPIENITAWTPTELTLYVPSNFARAVSGVTYSGVAATGFLTISNNNGLSANSPQPLTIFRSEFTADGIPGSPSYRQLRYVGPSSRQGYEFNYDPAYFANPYAVRGAQQAMRRWRRKTQLNIGDQTDAGITASPGDAISNIYYTGPSTGGPNYMRTLVSARHCTDTRTNGQFLYIIGIDIQVNPMPTEPWSYDTLRAVPAGSRDFYSAILHEMGHAAGLTHIADAGRVMYPVTPAVGTARRLLSVEPELNGVVNFFNRSTTAYACQSSQAAYPPLMVPITDPAQQLGAQMNVRTVLRGVSANCLKNDYDAFDANTAGGVTYNWLPVGAYVQPSTTYLASFRGLSTQRWVYGSRFGLGDVGFPTYSFFCPGRGERVAAPAPRTVAYPNPSTGDVTIGYDPTPGTRQVRLVLYSAQGVAVRSHEFAAGAQRTQFQLAGLQPGIYLLRTVEDGHAQPGLHLEVQ